MRITRERVRGLCLAQRAANNITIITANYFKIIIITCVLVSFFFPFENPFFFVEVVIKSFCILSI